MNKKLINSNIYSLPWKYPGDHFLHLATVEMTIGNKIRRFVHFCDAEYLVNPLYARVGYNEVPAYIEEITDNADEPKKIRDDDLWLDIEQFLADNNVHYCQRVNLPDNLWRKHPQDKKYFVVPTCQDIFKMPLPTIEKSGKS